MQAVFTLSRDQFIAANYQLAERPRRIATAMAALFLLLLGAIFTNGLPLPTAVAFFSIIVVAGAICLLVVGPRSVKKRFGRLYDGIPSLQTGVRCSFDPAGVTMETGHGRLRLDFANLHKLVETRDFIFLYTAPATAQLLPKESLDQKIRSLLALAPTPR